MTDHDLVRVLVVDDEPDLELLIRQKFRREIQNGALQFSFAGDGLEALQVLQDEPEVEVVLSDIRMPRMDGLTLLGKLREQGGIHRVVIVSAYGDMDNIRTAMNRGAFDFITKPIDFEDLKRTLRKTYNEVLALRHAFELQKKVTAIERELEVASQIQLSVLPSTFPPFPDRDEVDLYGTMLAAKEVGGDFYDYFWVDEDHLAFVVGDVAGKGVGAAMFMAIARTLIRSTALENRPVHQVFCHVNRTLYMEKMRHMFVTAVYGVLDVRTGELSCSNAGHHAPVRIGSEGVERMDVSGGPVLCALPEFEFESTVSKLAPGETIFLYTDGVPDAEDIHNERFGEDRLYDALRGLVDQPPAEILRHTLRSVESFTGFHSQADDITMLGLRYRG